MDEPDLLQAIHHYSTWGWLALVGLHVCGVLFESIAHRDNLIWAMITGCKRVCKVEERQAKRAKPLISLKVQTRNN
jgi:cytochrome b